MIEIANQGRSTDRNSSNRSDCRDIKANNAKILVKPTDVFKVGWAGPKCHRKPLALLLFLEGRSIDVAIVDGAPMNAPEQAHRRRDEQIVDRPIRHFRDSLSGSGLEELA